MARRLPRHAGILCDRSPGNPDGPDGAAAQFDAGMFMENLKILERIQTLIMVRFYMII